MVGELIKRHKKGQKQRPKVMGRGNGYTSIWDYNSLLACTLGKKIFEKTPTVHGCTVDGW